MIFPFLSSKAQSILRDSPFKRKNVFTEDKRFQEDPMVPGFTLMVLKLLVCIYPCLSFSRAGIIIRIFLYLDLDLYPCSPARVK